MQSRIYEVLEKYYGYKEFRKGQKEVIEHILSGNDVLTIMSTGSGKSICYQVPALVLDGLTIVISPLISLMKDQVDAMRDMGIPSAYINSSLSTTEFNEVMEGIRNEKYKILYIAPERLDSYEFYGVVAGVNISQIAIDEAHCVSQWGHDFRSSYRRISGFIDRLNKRPIITAFTATASKEVRQDIVKLLRLQSPKIFITGFDRENLSINIIKGENKKKFLMKYLEKNKENSGIIYAATRKEVDNIYKDLYEKGFSVARYHAGLSDEERSNNQEEFIYDRIKLMVATNAFGMGIDKSNIRYVIHYNMPKNIEGYYQEIGRAGRDGEKSECVLLFAPGDIHTQKYLIEVGVENPERKNNQYKALQQMVDFVYSNDCYRSYILNYFGEQYGEQCGNCSNCLNEGEILDKTVDSQKVLSCIYRMKRNFGSTMVIDVLRGSKNKKVLDLNFNELSTYGIMKDYSADNLKNFINTLISHGYLSQMEGTYPVLALNQKSMEVLRGQHKVLFKEFKVQEKKSVSNELFDLLKELRFNMAKEAGIPPYIIFGDGTLREMSSKYPQSKEEFLEVSGVGEVKYNKYGAAFKEVIKNYIKENKIEIKVKQKSTEDKVVKEESEQDVESRIAAALTQDENDFYVTTDEELFKALLKLREELSQKEGAYPPGLISKNTLKEISGRYPDSMEKLKDIGGFGPKKIEKYGAAVLEVVNDYTAEKQLFPQWEEKKRKRLVLDGEERKNNQIALDMLSQNRELKEISEELEVSISTILGYVTDYIDEFGRPEFNLDLSELFTEEEEAVIMEVCERVGYDKVSKVKAELPDTIKYEAIRAVILKNYK
ncbi:DNA helicase RecQ [Clostridium culturomicium]|uniref:DNA helicase RecQ n=1 Tax=Clostridium culturomicium TaxID=1499683 RepID=UPI00058E2BB6|nr:DNA helicase RecQ [Clostridium culturomicium]